MKREELIEKIICSTQTTTEQKVMCLTEITKSDRARLLAEVEEAVKPLRETTKMYALTSNEHKENHEKRIRYIDKVLSALDKLKEGEV